MIDDVDECGAVEGIKIGRERKVLWKNLPHYDVSTTDPA
jgi:hypothetical protein